MTADIFTLCDYAQESDGKLTVVGAFDTIYARRFPAMHPSMCLAVRLRFFIHEAGRHAIRITFTAPDGVEPVKAIDGETSVQDFSGSSRVVHSVFTLLNTPIEREGTMGITLTVDGRELLTSPLYAKKVT
ncbi:MAG: hypothetical protein M0Z80_04660 [Treponema sp.]|nr:hypothetical protein [Treponema sp.]